MRNFLLSVTLVCIGFAVNAQPPKVPANAGSTFGVKTTADNAVTVEQLAINLKGKTGPVNVKVKGTVTEVCKMMGCWIKVQSANGDMTVKMQDEKFLVPLALNGKSVVIDGIAEQKVTTVEELRHEAEDAKKTKAEIAKITAPKTEIVIQAKGILVL